jgi:DNA-binding HxlR family transcriptional regulator
MTLKTADSSTRIWEKGKAIVPNAPICNCPIATSLSLLGKKWTMLVLRDIAMRDMGRFSQLMKGIPGITPRMLSSRLKDLERHGMIVKTANRKSAKAAKWYPTEKGWDALPILFSYTAFGSKWFASQVFEDGNPERSPRFIRSGTSRTCTSTSTSTGPDSRDYNHSVYLPRPAGNRPNTD